MDTGAEDNILHVNSANHILSNKFLPKCSSLLLQTVLNADLRFMLQHGMDILIPWKFSPSLPQKLSWRFREDGNWSIQCSQESNKALHIAACGVRGSWFFIFCQHRSHHPILHSRRRDVDLLIILLEKFIGDGDGDRDRGGKRKKVKREREEEEKEKEN